ncbi:MAG: beta-ketoacyl-ACP synthase II [Candidatus Babeliales bacterium]
MSEKNRVVITGIGLVTPLGDNTKTTWNSLLEGRSGLSLFEHPELQNYKYNVVGLVKEDKNFLDSVFLPAKQRKTDRFIQLAVLAAHQAMLDAGFSTTYPETREKFGVCLGVGIGGLSSIKDSAIQAHTNGVKTVSPFLIPKVISNLAPAWICMEWNLQGSVSAIVNACSSSGDSVGYSFRMIRDGYADFMLTGGTESCINPLSIAGFGNMRSLATLYGGQAQKSSRPFDKDRTGFVMSEGAGILILENFEHANKRGANIYAEIVGYASTCDAFHITAMHPDGTGACNAIKMALQDAQIDKNSIGYINAHGTATKMNDVIETKILKKSGLSHALVSSTKSMTGHLLGAAGGTEISYTALALKHQVVPPTINLDNPDPECDLDYVPHVARQVKIDFAMSNSFGFGGGNSVVILKNYR